MHPLELNLLLLSYLAVYIAVINASSKGNL